MKPIYLVCRWLLSAIIAMSFPAIAAPQLDLNGYVDDTGAISVLYGGDSADPYFAMQALLLAHVNGFDISAAAEKFVKWLAPMQKPDGTFDRFCRSGSGARWNACKTADADDALLAYWMRLLETMPAQLKNNPLWTKCYFTSKTSLAHLFQPSRGIYMVSPVYLHGLFMDNLEVWSLKVRQARRGDPAQAQKLATAIHDSFWDPVNKRFLVSTQLEQRTEKPAFYPDHVAQIFPLLVDFPLVPGTATSYYREWMKAHRADWLRQSATDYPWGVLAVLAVRQHDAASARCWLREAVHLRHSSRWAITDEVAYQIVSSAGLKPALQNADCA